MKKKFFFQKKKFFLRKYSKKRKKPIFLIFFVRISNKAVSRNFASEFLSDIGANTIKMSEINV